MRWGLILGVAGCGFTGPGVGGDAAPTLTDARPGFAGCTIATTGQPIRASATIGDLAIPATHGAPAMGMQCPVNQLPISIGVQTTQNPRLEAGNGGERVVRTISMTCGAFEFTATSVLMPTPIGAVKNMTSNACISQGWDPIVTAPPVSCAAGQVPVGLLANGGTSTLFNNVAIACGQLAVSGDVVAPNLSDGVKIVDSGDDTNNPQMAICPAHMVLVGFERRSDCALDQVTPVCSALGCQRLETR